MHEAHAELAACALLTLPGVTDQRACRAVCRFEFNSICIAFCTFSLLPALITDRTIWQNRYALAI